MPTRRRAIPRWLPFAATTWAFAFGCLHLVWALGLNESGFRWSLALSGQAETDLIHDPALRLEGLWGVVTLCWLAALIALATVLPWAARLPYRLRLIGVWGVTVVLLLRAFFYTGFVFSGLRVAGVLPVSKRADPTWYRWDLVLWSPWFLLGAVLFGLSVRRLQRQDDVGESDLS